MTAGPLLAVATTLAFSLSCWGAGRPVLRLTGVRDGGTGLRIATEFLLGLTIVGAVLTGLGLLGLLRPGPVLATMAAGASGLWPVAGERRRAGADLAAALGRLRTAGPAGQGLALLTLLLVLGYGAAALVRPAMGDAEAFYLVYPRIMAATGVLEPMPGLYRPFSTIGLPLELHYAALMSLAGTPAAKLAIWPVGLACAALLAAIVGACGGGWLARTLAVAMLFTSQTFTLYLTDGKVDNVAAALGLAACAWAVRSWSGPLGRDGLLIGFLAGAATVAKFTYIPTLGLSLAILVVWRLHAGLPDRSEAWRETLRTGAVGTLAASVAWLPQVVKNAVLFGAPLAPFLGTGQDNWLEQVWFSAEDTRHIVLTYPLALVFGRYPMQGGGLSLLFLAFAPLAWFLVRPRATSPLVAVGVAALAGTVVWVGFRPSVIAPRYILATLLLFTPLVACAAEAAWRSLRGAALVRTAMAGTVVAAVAASAWHLIPVPAALVDALRDRLSACAMASEHCPALQAVNERAAPGDRIVLAGHYGYWLRPDLLQCLQTPAELSAIAAAPDPVAALRRGGHRFVVADAAVHGVLVDRLLSVSGAPGGLVAIARSGAVHVFAVPEDGPPAERSCREATPGRWHVRP